jgi:hypothetical protein
MPLDETWFPHAMTMHDLRTMREAVQLAYRHGEATSEQDSSAVPLIVYRYYCRGMTDPDRLASIALFLSSSRTFSRPAPSASAFRASAAT